MKQTFLALVIALLLTAGCRTIPGQDVRYEPTPTAVVRAMLELAGVGPQDVVYDLGSGDGRIPITAAKEFGARGVGIEINPAAVARAQANARKASVADKVEFRLGDMYAADVRAATVVTLFLHPQPNLKLRPKLRADLQPGSRVVSYMWDMGDWTPDEVLRVNRRRIFLWRIQRLAFDPDSRMNKRILGALKGVATGDAIGKQTETLSREAVLRWYPDGVRGFEGPPGTVIPRYVGNSKREWRIGETTDDTERTIAVAQAILQDGGVRHASVGRELLKCKKSVHPGVKSLWEFHQADDPARVAQSHDGCGAAVRVAPVGIVYSSGRLDDIVAAAREASISTHGGALAIAAAAATAAAVSAAIDGASPPDIIELAQRAATQAECQRSGSAHATFAQAIRTIHADLRRSTELYPGEVAGRYFPKDPLTIVPLAVTLGTVMESAEAAILLATNIGGDSDSVASIAGAILGARYPDTVNDEWYAVVEMVNDHNLISLAEDLSRLRC